MKKLEALTEFECKYRTDEKELIKFKRLVEAIPEEKTFHYAQGPDIYYTTKLNVDCAFARYRKASHEKKPTAWLTYKKKLVNNRSYKRKEPNIFVTGTPLEAVETALQMHGYSRNFQITKFCHIYYFEDATVVFYTVVDEKDTHFSFIEIEVKEETISEKTEDEAWEVIKKYESYLEPMGITYKNRMQKSLFDLFKKEEK